MTTPGTRASTPVRAEEGGTRSRRYRPGSVEVLLGVLLVAVLLRGQLVDLFSSPGMATWATTFVSVCVQATPFLVLGVLVSGAIAAFVPASLFRRVLPERAGLAVPVAGACGALLPGCECGSIPIANRLMDRGVRPSAALAFLLSAPAINPIVLVATAVAFSSDQRMVWARLVAGLLTAVVVGLVWERIGRPEWLAPRRRLPESDERGAATFLATVRGDFTQAAGFLVLGAAVAASFKVIVPARWMEHVGSSLLLSVALMAVLAFMLALCSEADAFVVASFATIPMVGKLVFLTVGPAVDVKLVALQTGTFGRRFAVRFAPLTFAVAVTVGLGVGLLFFGGGST